jgi:hypothetical protein
MSVIFLDIDGVVLTLRAWALPENERAAVKMQHRDPRPDVRRALQMNALRLVSFDAEAVRLVVRLAERTDSRIVISSDWRKTIADGGDFARAKMVEQGIPERLFHPDWHTPIIGSNSHSAKAREVTAWLEAHRQKPPPPPEPTYPVLADPQDRTEFAAAVTQYNAAWKEWLRAKLDYGIDHVILDDEGHDLRHLRLVETRPDTGFAAWEYVLALRFLGGNDPEMGVHKIADADWTRISAAFGGDTLDAAWWLHDEDGGCPADALNGGDEEARAGFWQRLAAVNAPWKPDTSLDKASD